MGRDCHSESCCAEDVVESDKRAARMVDLENIFERVDGC